MGERSNQDGWVNNARQRVCQGARARRERMEKRIPDRKGGNGRLVSRKSDKSIKNPHRNLGLKRLQVKATGAAAHHENSVEKVKGENEGFPVAIIVN